MHVPKGWKIESLSYLIEKLEAGISVNSEDRKIRDGEIGILKTSAVSYDRFQPDQHKAVLPDEINRVSLAVRADSIIVSRMNTPALVGANAYVDVDYPNLYLPDRLWQTTKTAVEHSVKWLSYVLQSPNIRTEISNRASGTSGSMKNISQDSFLSIDILLPPLPEQRKIAAILGTWDEAIDLTRRLIEALKQRKQALMQLLLTGEVRFPGFDEDWEEVRLRGIGKIVSGGTPDTNNPTYWDGDIYWSTPTDITALTTKYIHRTEYTITESGLKNSSASVLPKGSVLVCTRATVGAAAINTVPMATNQGFKSVIPNQNFMAEYVFYLISANKHLLMRLSNGSTFLELSKADFEGIAFSLPQFPEQRAISDVLQTLDDELENLHKHLILLQAQKRGLMQKLLTGQVRVQVEGE